MTVAVSVLMSIYNGERYLREAVDSILAQTFTDFEFVIVNDGSTDATGEILASYLDPRLKVFTIRNGGLPAALNCGLEQCSSDLVVRMDADDVAYPHRFAVLLDDWEKAERPDVFGSGADFINEDGLALWGVSMPLDDETIRAEILDPNGRMTIMHPSVLLRKEAVLACGGYDPYFKNGQDYDLWLRMSARFRFGNSPGRLLKYRFQPCSDTATAAHVISGQLYFGTWMRLLSLQKKLLIDADDAGCWFACRDQIIGALRQRADISALMAETVTLRFLTEAKILYYSGKRKKGALQIINRFLRHPGIVIKRFSGAQMTDLSKYLLSLGEIEDLTAPH